MPVHLLFCLRICLFHFFHVFHLFLFHIAIQKEARVCKIASTTRDKFFGVGGDRSALAGSVRSDLGGRIGTGGFGGIFAGRVGDIGDDPLGDVPLQILVKVAIVEDNVELLMEDFDFPENGPRSRPDHIIDHVLVNELQICADGHIEIHSAAVICQVISSEGVDDVREACAHRQQVDQLVHSHFALARRLPVVAADFRHCPLLQE